jgi:hypothetical protein
VSEDDGAMTDVNVRIQKATGSFSKLRKAWLSTSIRMDTKIRDFNACLKSVFLYGCETWLVTSEIRSKILTFVTRCLRYNLRTWCPKIISNNAHGATTQDDVNLEIGKRKFEWFGHTLRKDYGEIPKAT